MSEKRIVFCQCEHARVIKQSVKDAVFDKLNDAGVEFETVTDLCELSARKDPKMAELANSDLNVVACFPRAVKSLFQASGHPVEDDKIAVQNMREDDPELIVKAVLPSAPKRTEAEVVVKKEIKQAESKPWKPWFPVIDFNRCTNCMQCLSFCLFGVYGVSKEEKIEVQNPDKCKTDCPACSRVCPDVAIMFPKYRAAPINGAEVSSDDMRREKMKVDISSLLGGDIYATLRDRNAKAKSRFSKERDDDKALKERIRCLKELKEGLDIPDEVLMSLPSMTEIENKFENHKKKIDS